MRRLFETALLQGEAERLKFSAGKLNKVEDEEAREEKKSPPPDFKFNSSVIQDAERLVENEQL